MSSHTDILISEDVQSPAFDALEKKYSVHRDGKLWNNPAQLETAIASARVIVVRNQTQVTAKLMEAATKLIGVGRLGVGLDNIDMPAATKLGVVVVSPANANATSVAELAMGMMLGLARKIPAADVSTKAGGWDRRGFTGIEIEGKTLGLCGFGRIGAMVATRARAFGMKLLAYDPFLKPDAPQLTAAGATYCGKLEDLLAGADFVSLHMPQTPETKKMFNTQLFAAMKPGAYFINTSRGGLVDETALIEALQKKHLAGAGLDVREIEPPTTRSALDAMPNVILTPHTGSFTAEAQRRTMEAVAADIDKLLSGLPVENGVNLKQPAASRVTR